MALRYSIGRKPNKSLIPAKPYSDRLLPKKRLTGALKRCFGAILSLAMDLTVSIIRTMILTMTVSLTMLMNVPMSFAMTKPLTFRIVHGMLSSGRAMYG